MTNRKNLVLDTSVLLYDKESIHSFPGNDVVIPITVLDELDRFKDRPGLLGESARYVNRFLDFLRQKGRLDQGVYIDEEDQNVKVTIYDPDLIHLSSDKGDNKIIATALQIKDNDPDKILKVITKDINMRVKCDALGLLTEDYQAEQVVENSEGLYTGRSEMLVDEQIVDQFYAGEEIWIDPEEHSLHPNQFIMLISNSNDKKTALARKKNRRIELNVIRVKEK